MPRCRQGRPAHAAAPRYLQSPGTASLSVKACWTAPGLAVCLPPCWVRGFIFIHKFPIIIESCWGGLVGWLAGSIATCQKDTTIWPGNIPGVVVVKKKGKRRINVPMQWLFRSRYLQVCKIKSPRKNISVFISLRINPGTQAKQKDNGWEWKIG